MYAKGQLINHLRRLAGPAAFFALAVFWNNVWAQIRDTLSSSFFSDSSVAAYSLASQIPFYVPSIIHATVAAAMVPVLVELRQASRDSDAWRVARGVLTTLAIALAVFVLAGALLAGPLLQMFFVWDAKHPAGLALASHLFRLLMLYLLLSGVSAVAASILQAFERFRPLTLALFFPNFITVACILAFRHSLGIASQVTGAVMGTSAYLVVVFISLYRLQIGCSARAGTGETANSAGPWWRLAPMRTIGRTALPLLLFNLAYWATTQLAVFRALSGVAAVDRTAWKEFENAYRILLIPQSIFVRALALVLLPYFSGFAATDQSENLASATISGIRIMLYAVGPTVVLLGLLSAPLINILYRHGEFTAHQALAATPLVALMAPYPLLCSVAMVLVQVLLALKRASILLAVQLGSLFAAIVFTTFLPRLLGLSGLSLAVTLVALVNVLALFWAVSRHLRIEAGANMWQFLWQLSVACSVLWIVVAVLKLPFEAVHLSFRRSVAEVFTILPVSGVLYGGVSGWLQIPEWQAVRTLVARRR